MTHHHLPTSPFDDLLAETQSSVFSADTYLKHSYAEHSLFSNGLRLSHDSIYEEQSLGSLGILPPLPLEQHMISVYSPFSAPDYFLQSKSLPNCQSYGSIETQVHSPEQPQINSQTPVSTDGGLTEPILPLLSSIDFHNLPIGKPTTPNGSASLNNHLKKHVCDRCSKWYSRAYNLKVHKETHFSSRRRKEYACPYEGCNREFIRKHALERHTKTRHWEDRVLSVASSATDKSETGALQLHDTSNDSPA